PVADVAADIDRLISERLNKERVSPSPRSDDAEFLRRVYLDITGRLPTMGQAVAFLDSREPDKRTKLIDDLLADPNYGRHFGLIGPDATVNRDAGTRNRATAAFKKGRGAVLNDTHCWAQTVKEMLPAEGTAPPSTFFLAHQDMGRVAPNKIVG